MLVIGLTGGIGSGKSVVAQLFAQYGVPIIDADIVARQVTEPGQLAYEKIVTHFGQHVLQLDGTINRRALRTKIFNDKNDRVWLEELLHPIIIKTIKQEITTLKPQQTKASDAQSQSVRPIYPYCIVVIPLLFESDRNQKRYHFIDRILVVDATELKQIERVNSRDHMEKEAILAILETQVKRAERLSQAHDIIYNDGLISDLEPQVEKLHHFYSNLNKTD